MAKTYTLHAIVTSDTSAAEDYITEVKPLVESGQMDARAAVDAAVKLVKVKIEVKK